MKQPKGGVEIQYTEHDKHAVHLIGGIRYLGFSISRGKTRQTAINAAQRRLKRLINDLEKLR